jgi:hypothetical protein
VNNKLFKIAFGLLCAIGIINYLGAWHYLYFNISWYDMVPHFLSGICIAISGIWFWQAVSNFKLSPKRLIFVGLFWVLFIGIVWELYELAIGDTLISDGFLYWHDTISDISLDFLGGLLGIFIALYISKYE